jgi:hypothetical protein
MINIKDCFCRQDQPCPAAACSPGAIVQDDVFSVQRIDHDLRKGLCRAFSSARDVVSVGTAS